jgi:predicted Zn-dependent peptidase
MMTYHTATLPNGLRIIHLPSASPVVYCGYQIAAGTRHEQPGQEGLAHFCEHVTFKGTARRNALQIINALEKVGGELNAFTNKEDTTFYAAIHRDHIRLAVDLLTDIVFHSEYPQAEIDKEVEVICDEIESYNDSPAELIYDEFENILFGGHPLGHNILGQAERLRTYTTADALSFTRRYYQPGNAIFFAYGNVDFQQLLRLLSKLDIGPAMPVEADSVAASALSPMSGGDVIVRQRGTHQAHVLMGCRAYDINHPRRMALYLLNNILGGPGMNSRLNLSLRERHGLVYTVDSSMVCYGDTGLWTVYFGCDPGDVGTCRRLVRRQLDRLMAKPLSRTQLNTAKMQIKGQIAIACDNRENFAIDFGKSFLHKGTEKDLEALFRQIDAVTAEDIQQVAADLFAADHITTLIYQ